MSLLNSRLGRRIGKFSIVGVANTLVDFAVLNLLMLGFGWTRFAYVVGLKVVLANLVSVSAAIVNSYVLNKFWTFRTRGRRSVGAEAAIFVAISLVGMLINTAVFSILYHHWEGATRMALLGFRQIGWSSPAFDAAVDLNLSKAIALAASMLWNFAAYSRWAFPADLRSKAPIAC